ncbi:hypothetical protein ACOME3_004668 [Neoechinorhynchus agilis]
MSDTNEKIASVLVTGGSGYIGTHCVISLCLAGFEVVVIDNYANSTRDAIARVEQILDERTNGQYKSLIFYEIDMANKTSLRSVFINHNISSVVHLAGLKAVGESIQEPLKYYHNNLSSSLNLLECMKEFNVNKIMFSSSATVYGVPEHLPLKEESSVGRGISNPYGQTKYMIEQILIDLERSKQIPGLSVVILRYFNPVGADKSGKIGESPVGPPANLMPFVAQVAAGVRPELNVFGNDYDTHDGTGVRDYIHVVDLAEGHVTSMKKFSEPGVHIYNLGTGKGYSVLDMVKALEKVSGRNVRYCIKPRRDGDIASVYCDPSKAERELGWTAKYGLSDMCSDLWRWQSQNPKGYEH